MGRWLKSYCGALVPNKNGWWQVGFLMDRRTLEICLGRRKTRPHMCQIYFRWTTMFKKTTVLGSLRNLRHLSCTLLGIQQFKLRKWRKRQSNGQLEVWLALQTIIMTTLVYPLAASTLSREHCEEIMRPILHYVLPVMIFPLRINSLTCIQVQKS